MILMKKRLLVHLTVTAMMSMTLAQSMILRNNALMNKMVSHFQKDNYLSPEQNQQKESAERVRDERRDEVEEQKRPRKVLTLMQSVLCKNFPTIPCQMIMDDETLKKLIEKSIQQIKYKTLSIEKTTAKPGYHLTMFPTINSEELSSFLQVRSLNKGFYDKRPQEDMMYKTKRQSKNPAEFWSQEKTQKSSKKNKDPKKTVYNGRKKIRKFYPHKIKYKDKIKNNARKDFGDYSEEKLSMSVEVPEVAFSKRHQHLSYKVEPADPPVWRIDYMKHGEPTLNNMLAYQDNRLKEKLMKAGPNVMVDDNVLEQGVRKNVMHQDVYIKKKYPRKNNPEVNSEGIEN